MCASECDPGCPAVARYSGGIRPEGELADEAWLVFGTSLGGYIPHHLPINQRKSDMTNETTNQADDDTRTLIDAAAAGLMGLATKALLAEGKASAVAILDAIEAGDAFIETTVIFTKRGVSAEGHYCSHGSKAHLFTVNAVAARKPTH